MQIGNIWRILVALLKREAISGRKKSGRENMNPLKTNERPLYLKHQCVPLCKHFSSQL